MGKHVYTYINPTSEKTIKEACHILEQDGVIVLPTDVNWAFACDSFNSKAIDRLRRLKPEHPKEQPFSLICHSISMIAEYAQVDQWVYRILKKILPGPYTILLERNRSFPKQMKDNRKVVGVRYPDSPLMIDLVTHLGRPLATSSLPHILKEHESKKMPNREIRFGYEVAEVYAHSIDLILDLGLEVLSQETSILDLSAGELKVVREGLGDISTL